jgi:hypothetical protein
LCFLVKAILDIVDHVNVQSEYRFQILYIDNQKHNGAYSNQEWTIQRHWQHWANKKPTKNSKKKIKQNNTKTTTKKQKQNKTKQNKQIHATP